MYHYLEEELDQLRTRIIKMGSLVEEQIEFAFRALFEGNLELAKLVVERDDKVDKFDIKIDKHCQRIFALTQPVAIDLRLIMSALKINNDLERMGDIAVNIAERVPPLMNYRDLLVKMKLDEMTAIVQKIVKGSIDSFINNDPENALEIIKMDSVVDNMDIEIFQMLVDEMKQNNDYIEPCSHAITLLRNIERLADHAVNIAEDVFFLTDAKIVKHKKEFHRTQDEGNF
ncbi:MAG: phosphate signaling complex protein PhoU [Ignavibacteriaceae bacterium]|jgi:phosphate transport system regulatory protein PhoU|nr:MAG: phosphate signaling complex protein PhoU [Chlorobiota bacterium]KXK06065.1 MAG: phosphate transport system protein [Chlorobi bacterium OLB4]MBV6398500.1 Phosphate-specific transport system accessory protein PhoU [Ignavibacteria bacterium]MCC6885734.1 phosphate signaling complex protein PhoU [Ignavibacteriales bacterium]MCE7953071.1 phosphate transport system regulatory protein PhoU [Chlorobi bacterium CHB7]MDL1887091.1 phosphate signaling complex protein PhoU [Ignavibacteria bacterium 